MTNKRRESIRIEEIRRQFEADVTQCDINSPIKREYETLQPCVEAGRKVLDNESLKSFFHDLYTRR